MKTLSEIANELETDKGTADARTLSWGSQFPLHHCWHYTKTYEKYMDPMRDKPVTMMEIGICDSRFPLASPKMWKEYFKDVELYCIDNFWSKKFEFEMIRPVIELGASFIYADQNSEKDWNLIKEKVPHDLDFIVEDGSHDPHHMMYSLYQSCDLLKPGGYYFMEDIDNPNGPIGLYGYDNSTIFTELKYGHNSLYLTQEQNEAVKNSFDLVELVPDPTNKNYLAIFKRK